MDFQGANRRVSVRARRIVTVRHRLFKRSGKKFAAGWMLSTTENMSATGLLFNSPVVYKLNDVVEVQVVMSGILDIFNGVGKVVRVETKRGGYYYIAVHYVGLKPRRRSAKTLIGAR